MAIDFREQDDGRAVEITATGKLEKEDYDTFVPHFDALIEKYEVINILFIMQDFEGFEMWALWEDIKFEWEHYSDIGRLAMVGETSWSEWMAVFCKPFTKSAVRYFEPASLDEARAWVRDYEAED